MFRLLKTEVYASSLVIPSTSVRALTTIMTTLLKGKLPQGHVSIVPSLLLALALLGSVTANPVPSTTAAPQLEPWRAPCTMGSQTTANVTAILGNLKDAVGDVKSAAEAWKDLLTASTRISSDDASNLERATNTHVGNFPHSVDVIKSETNDTKLMMETYVILSKIYIFINKSRDNAGECDTRSDASTLWTQMDSLKGKLLLALCQTDKYLTVRGHPMPADQIPGADILQGIVPNMLGMQDEGCDNMAATSRDTADYLIARDTAVVMDSMAYRFQGLHTSMTSGAY